MAGPNIFEDGLVRGERCTALDMIDQKIERILGAWLQQFQLREDVAKDIDMIPVLDFIETILGHVICFSPGHHARLISAGMSLDG